MKAVIFFCLFNSIGLLLPLHAAITVRPSKTTLSLNESLTLDISVTGNPHNQPNFKPLQLDFDILSSSQSQAATVINGKVSVETRWHLVLMPKHEGFLSIPSISIDQEHSQPRTIEVTAPRESLRDESILLEAEISPKDSVYEQGQLLYTLKLYRSVNLAQAALSEVKADDPDAIIEPLNQDHEYETIRPNGSRYIVLERKYAIYPQRTGELTIAPVVFEGKVIKGGNSFFNVQTEFKRVTSRPVKCLVKPVPAPFDKSNWIIAKDVKIFEEWSADPSSITLGEPLTWTIKINTEGFLGSQIPPLSLNIPDSLKTYFDKPEMTNTATAQGIIGSHQVKIALIATKPREITLPEIDLTWMDASTGEVRHTTLPSRVLQVQGEPLAFNDDASSLTGVTEEEFTPPALTSDTPQDLPRWAAVLISLNSIWIYIFLKRIYQKFTAKATSDGKKANSLRSIKALLKQACLENDPKKTEAALLAWASALYPQIKPLNLVGIRPYLSASLQEPISELNETLYGKQSTWDGQTLWKAVAAYKIKPQAPASSPKPKSLLRELY